MSEARISVQGMRNEAEAITALNTQMAAEYQAIIEAIQKLRGQWQGDAAEQAVNATNKMNPKFEAFQNAVKGGVRNMQDHASKWEKAERQITELQNSAASQYRT